MIGIKSSEKKDKIVNELKSRLDSNTKGVPWADVVRKQPLPYVPSKTKPNSRLMALT